jgi:chromosome partitioning protein
MSKSKNTGNQCNIIAVSNHKGGVGKTTSTLNIGAGLNQLGKKVLLIDLDPQANLSQSFAISNSDYNIYGAIRGLYPIKPINILEGLDIVASTVDLSGAEIELSGEPGREFILKELIDPLKSNYDYILIDCPPSLSLLTINALTCSNNVYIPLQAEFLALQGLSKLVEVIELIKKRLNKELSIGGVFITQYDKRKVLNREILSSIQKYFPNVLFKTLIRDNVALAEAPTHGLDIFRYNPKCYGAVDYLALCKEIIAVKTN